MMVDNKASHFCLKGVKRIARNRAVTFLKSQNNRFLGSSGLSKIVFLQSYEVHWTHVIDAICTLTLIDLIQTSKRHFGHGLHGHHVQSCGN